MYGWLKLWDETQSRLKTLSHNTILKGRAAGMRTQMGKLEALVKNDELVEFMREFTSAQGFSRTRLEGATTWIERVLGDLDERLAAHQWLAGDALSLADLAWSIALRADQISDRKIHGDARLVPSDREPSEFPADGARL
jgi:glutathione S-transferase